MKRFTPTLLMSLLIAHALSLPDASPYKELTEILPPEEHGWFDPTNQTFLDTAIAQREVKCAVELGVWLGSSAMFIANRLPEGGHLYAIDTWDGGPEAEDVYRKHYNSQLSRLWPQFLSNVIHADLSHKITPLKMTTLQGAEVLKNRIFPDLVYVDACHLEEFVYADINAWYPFVKENGLICGDDYLIPSVARAVDRFAKERGIERRVYGRLWWFVPKDGWSGP